MTEMKPTAQTTPTEGNAKPVFFGIPGEGLVELTATDGLVPRWERVLPLRAPGVVHTSISQSTSSQAACPCGKRD
jgi:hypothetical protein